MTAAGSSQPKQRNKRWRYLRLALWAAFLAWCARYSYIRWTTPPAAFGVRALSEPADLSRAEELITAVRALPPPRVAATNWVWGARASATVMPEGLRGPWSPATSTVQRRAVNYVRQPSARDALDRIVTVVAQAREASAETVVPAGFRPAAGPPFEAPECVAPTVALAFRARYRHAEQSDLAGALADLQTALFVSQRDYVVLSPRVGWWYHQPLGIAAEFELGCLVQEHDLPPTLTKEMIAFLRDELSLSVSEAVSFAARLHAGAKQFLDRYYTDDGAGNGWLVLSAVTDRPHLPGSGTTGPRSGAWNLFSPLFNSRRTMLAKYTRQYHMLGELDSHDYYSGMSLATREYGAELAVNILDGPLVEMTAGVDTQTFVTAFAQVMRRRAAVVMLALSAYKHEHGKYPATLEALVPDYLDEIPLDAFTHQPFEYTPRPATSPPSYDLKPARRLDRILCQTAWGVDLEYPADSYLPRRNPDESADDTADE